MPSLAVNTSTGTTMDQPERYSMLFERRLNRWAVLCVVSSWIS
jgi:hypothetical protein